MKAIKQSYTIKAGPHSVFEALTNPVLIEKWSGTKAVMDAKAGTKFSLWDGDMFGTNLEVVEDKKLVQEWCTSKFVSKVTFTLKPKGSSTVVDLLHENVPADSIEDYSHGWEDYYLGAIRDMFEEI
jgi:activator of HSP90 ATPase